VYSKRVSWLLGRLLHGKGLVDVLAGQGVYKSRSPGAELCVVREPTHSEVFPGSATLSPSR
jgi:hypothetical protein